MGNGDILFKKIVLKMPYYSETTVENDVFKMGLCFEDIKSESVFR